ncbi:LysE family translocator [Falsibacillus albus]|uniref:LysE family translocator n=1 Tax=Falsibacillus albus TaxID=2478915 RepID=A0A3L7JWP6_9BACI|nr:LysE family transporter [Falsibacillus albus]RLQ94539.1 LysE family translocator [Falsibacillus albus]
MNFTSFIIYCMIVTFTPGPTNIVILSTAHNLGTKKAMHFTYGATIAFGILLAVSTMLNTLLIAVLPKILIVMQVVGSLYMFYLAYQIVKKNASKTAVNETATFRTGFLMQFLNPKMLLFAMTVIPSFILPHYIQIPALTISVFAITLIGFSAFITWVLFGTIFKKVLQKHSKIVNVVMALFLAYSAVMIWM